MAKYESVGMFPFYLIVRIETIETEDGVKHEHHIIGDMLRTRKEAVEKRDSLADAFDDVEYAVMFCSEILDLRG